MAFFRQLQLLLWKNWLRVIRRPLWSLTLIIWPLVIFIIIAVTRNQFPPLEREPCYAGPRNLPSTGFFPFLQTLMCNTDSSCHNTSRIVDPSASKSSRRARDTSRSDLPQKSSPLVGLIQGDGLKVVLPKDPDNDPEALLEVLNNILGPTQFGAAHNGSLIYTNGTTPVGDQESLNKMLESLNLLKRAICTMTLPMINNTTPSPFSYAVLNFCQSNDTVLEVSLLTLNEILTKLMLSEPEEMMKWAGLLVLGFDELQNQSSLWDTLLDIPRLLTSGSFEELLHSTGSLLTDVQGALQFIQSNFPEVKGPLSSVHPLLAGGINLVQYVENWRGKDVYISLGDVLTWHNNSLVGDVVKQALQEVQIPLHQAIALAWDRDLVHQHLCNNSKGEMWVTAVCSTGLVDTIMGWICQDKIAKQALLAWSKNVASHDVSFAKGLLHSLMGASPPGHGGSSAKRHRRSVDTPPQSIEEELFLEVGKVLMDILEIAPDVEAVVQAVLGTGFQSMNTVTLTLETVDEIMTNLRHDANQIRMAFHTLLTNQSQSSMWMARILDGVFEVTMKLLSPGYVTCEDVLGPFEWLLEIKTLNLEMWRSAICRNSSMLEQAVLMDWQMLIHEAQELYGAIVGHPDYNVTLPMILSEWHRLYNSSVQLGECLGRLGSELGGDYWMDWMPENSSLDIAAALQQSVFQAVEDLGGKIEKSPLWPQAKTYFHLAYWVLNYKPGVTMPPANCSLDYETFAPRCDTGFSWVGFTKALYGALMSENQDVLVNCLKGTVNLLEHLYGDFYRSYAQEGLGLIEGGHPLSEYLTKLMLQVDSLVQHVSTLPDRNISNPEVMLPLVEKLLLSTGLSPLKPLLFGDGPFNASTVLQVATTIGRQNQDVFMFNESDPALPELERLLTLFLSSQNNLTMSLSQIMGYTLLTYSQHFNPEDVASLRASLYPYTRQTSGGSVEAILSAMELLQTVVDSPDPNHIVLGYIHQLQEFVMSLFRLRRIEQYASQSGELSPVQVTDLHMLSNDFLSLLTPEGLQNLTQIGPDAAQDVVINRFVAFLPSHFQAEAAHFLSNFKALQHHLNNCTAGQSCLAGILKIFMFVDQIAAQMLSAEGHVTISFATNFYNWSSEDEQVSSLFFSLLLSSADASYVQTFRQTLHFIKQILTTPGVTVSDAQDALRQSNLTLAELKHIAMLAGAANVNDLIVNMMQIINIRECFGPQDNPTVTAQCVKGLIHGVGDFLVNVPALRNETAILSLIPVIINSTINDVLQTNLSSSPDTVILHVLNRTLANIKTSLQQSHLSTPEIMKEIKVLEGLIHLATNQEPIQLINAAETMDPTQAQRLYLTVIDWYLKRLENITSSSSAAELLHPFFYLTQMQVTLQLSQTNFSLFVSSQIEHLMDTLQYPIDAGGFIKIIRATGEILQRLVEVVKLNLEAQGNIPGSKAMFTAEELKDIAALAGASDMNDLIESMMQLISVRQCFGPQDNPTVTTQCVKGLIHGVGDFLVNVPALRNETAILSLIPVIINSTINDVLQTNLSSSPDTVILHVLNRTLANIKTSLQQSHLSTPEIMNEIKMLEGLIQLASNQEPIQLLNAAMLMDPIQAERVYLTVIDWYLKRLENITSSSSAAELLHPFFYLAKIEVRLLLAQSNFSLFVSSQVEHLMDTLQDPIDGTGLTQIGQGTVEIFRRLFEVIKLNLEAQYDSGPMFNTTLLQAAQAQVNMYLHLIQGWMKQPQVPVVLTSMLQWGNHSMNISAPVADFQRLLQTMVSVLSEDQLQYLSIIQNVTQALKEALKAAEQPGSMQGHRLIGAITEAVRTAMHLLTAVTGPLQPSTQQDILEITQYSLQLIVQPGLNFDASRNMSLVILARVESIARELLPETLSQYLLPALKVATTYFQTFAGVGGQNSWNQLILNEMETIRRLLPANSTAQLYVSVLIDITHSILDSGQGNMSLWAMFEKASVENLSMIFNQMSRILSKFWPLFMGPDAAAPALDAFVHLPSVLEQLMTEKADRDTWIKLERMLEALLSTLSDAGLWDNITSVVPQLEKVIASLVNTMQAENALLQSLQTPVETLIAEIALSLNGSRFNASQISQRLQLAIDQTVQAAEQANGTLDCKDVLTVWEPVREAAGLSHAAVMMWCEINLQPVIDAYNAEDSVYGHLGMSHMGVGPASVDAAAARIAKSIRSLYQVDVNRTLIATQLVTALSTQLSRLAGQELSPEALHHLLSQLDQMQLQSSLSSIRMILEQLLSEAPYLQPHIEATEKALSHIASNYHLLGDSESSQAVFTEAAVMLLSSFNITEDMLPAMLGNFSSLDLAFLIPIMREAVSMMKQWELFGSDPMVYEALEMFLESNHTGVMVQRAMEMLAWLADAEASGLDLLSEALPRIQHILQPLLSLLSQIDEDVAAGLTMFGDIAENIMIMLQKLLNSGLVSSTDYNPRLLPNRMTGRNHTVRARHRREALQVPARSPVDDFLDLLSIDYPTMFKALAVPVSTSEVLETAHLFFANPDLSVVVKGVTSDLPWALDASREHTIDAVLQTLSFLTLPDVFQMSSMDLLMHAANTLPDDFPFAAMIKNITRVLASESQDNLALMKQTFESVGRLLQTDLMDPAFLKQFSSLRSQPGQLCHTVMPGLEMLLKSLMMNTTALSDTVFDAVIGDPMTYDIHSEWSSVFTKGLSFNTSSLDSLKINITSPGVVTVGEVLRNSSAFMEEVQQHVGLDPESVRLLMETTLPNNNFMILSWLINLRHCNSTPSTRARGGDAAISETFCSMSAKQWYSFSLLMARHVNLEKVIYRMVLSDEMQTMVGFMLQVTKVLSKMMNSFLPAISQLQGYMMMISDLNLGASNEFSEMARGLRSSISTKATFVTLSRALCSKGILALFGIAQMPLVEESSSSFPDSQREEMIERFKIPRNATPFCTNMYLDMVNTTGGAIAWAFLKPMLMGQILYSPDTPLTRDIMEKANSTLQEFANLRKHSEDWIESSNYIVNSAQILNQTLPMLQNSLSNSFVRNFIEMQTDIDVGKMKETLSNFSNMTTLLEKNKHMLDQITTLSRLMVDLSSCIEFDRYRAFDSTDELNSVAAELAKNRDLYASVIFNLPKDEKSSRKREARSSSSSSSSSLPAQVSYTIRMHMDNVMRTDRVREPYFVKEPHISARLTMRYNRGFIYLQESIDRAIIQAQTGQRVTEPAVQLQPFPYPCHLRDEYLEAISFVFPLMLMMAWVLFVADFVKKLVQERELRLHEYMKMMGVNPLSHFFAWFLECAAYLVLTIIILTLVLKHGNILPHSDGFILFLYLCDYGLSVLAFSYLISSFFDKTYIAGLSGSLIYILFFFPYIVVMAVETNLSFSQKSALSLFSPTCFSYASQYVSRYEAQGEGIQWYNSYSSPMAGDTASFGWLCWLMLIDSLLYFFIGIYIRMVFPGKYGIPAPWYFPFKASFWAELCCCNRANSKTGRGLFFANVMQKNHGVLSDDKGKGQSNLSRQGGEDFSDLPVGVDLHGLTKIYGDRVAIENLNVSFYEGHVTSLLGHNGAGKTTTMSLLTGLFAPSSGSIEVYGRDMQANIEDVRRDLGVCMQYDVLFDQMTTKEHLLLYGQIKAPHWSQRELREQVRTILEETGMYAHRHKPVGTLSGGMKRKLSISIAFIGGSRLVVLDEPTTGVDPCSRRSIWDIVIQHKKNRTIIMSTHHLDEAEVLSDRIAFLERGGLKCCGSPFHLKDKLGQGYKLTLTKKAQSLESEQIDTSELKSFIQAHVPEARMKEAQGGDLVYSLPPFNSSNASSYRSLLTALDSNLEDLQLGGYGISDTTLEEVFLQLTQGHADACSEDAVPSISETVSDAASIDSFPSDIGSSSGDKIHLTGASVVQGMALAWQQMSAILIKRFHHSRRDWKGLLAQILLPVLFMIFAMGLGSIRSDVRHYPALKLSPALYRFEPSYSFFSNQNPNSSQLAETMMSFPGIDNACLDKSDNPACTRSTNKWTSSGNSSKAFSGCKCTGGKQVCEGNGFQPPHKRSPSSQVVYNLSGLDVENYLLRTADDFIRNRYGGFAFGMPLPPDLKMDITAVPQNRTLSKVWFNPEGHHTMPAYLNSLNNFILRSNLPADKDPQKYGISVSSQPYFGRADDEDTIIQGMLQILVVMCVLTGYSITTASFAIYEVAEHHSGSKRLQHISGISEPFYWAVNFLYDMTMYLIPVVLTIAVIAAFQIPAFTDRQNLGAMALLLVLFGFATFPWMYLLAGVFRDAEMAFITYVCINLFISVNTILSTSVLYFLSQISQRNAEAIQDILQKLSYAFYIFPQFNFGNGMMHLARKNIEVQLLSGYGVDAYQNPFSMDALGWMLISSFILGLSFFTLRLLLNRFLLRKVRRLIFGRKTVPQVAPEDEDEDVAAEHLRVSSGAASSDVLQVSQLTKVYQHLKRKVHAVKRISVGIPAGECFGLLGVNGAGKTTTFKMLTGDVSPTDGTAQIRDWDGRLVDIMECRNQGINIGYCPQVDALDNLLTGEEHLYFYGRIRGISKRELDGVVKYLLRRLELNYHRNIITDGYSCGTRRKLSTALALIGHPQILLLDEPSSGMDPRTKRHLWKIISEEVKGKCAVVLTSHSMEECEALCSRLAIMVKGQFRCLGSLQHIKNRFGSGFTVKMYLAEASCDTEAITSFMQHRFPSTYLKDQHSTMAEYHVPVAPGGVADIFDQLESNKNALQIKHFSVSQTTLDEVFINFAMGNVGMETISIDNEDGDDLGSIKAVET